MTIEAVEAIETVTVVKGNSAASAVKVLSSFKHFNHFDCGSDPFCEPLPVLSVNKVFCEQIRPYPDTRCSSTEP